MKLTPSEEDMKTQITDRFFPKSRYQIEKNRVDFAVCDKAGNYLFWAEAKKFHDVSKWQMLAQLILTIKPILDKGDILPPSFVGCFDASVITFVEFMHVNEVLIANDFNWKEKPSAVSQKTEKIVERILSSKEYSFDWKDEAVEVKKFINDNFQEGKIVAGQITKTNFVHIFNRWLKEVLPSIKVSPILYDKGIIAGDFYLADLLSRDNKTISEKLKVLLHYDEYKIQDIENLFKNTIVDFGNKVSIIKFKDGGIAHKHFWQYYKRPPKTEYHKYILKNRHLLVPSNIRERKGAYFTPPEWVEKSQEYLEKVFGENWQEDYYIWDCCAGTGNLEEGLSNPENIWVSTLDDPDTLIMKTDKILLQNHIFQFDFLEDSFDKLPKELKSIIDDPQKQKKLIIYINPPYAEATSLFTVNSKENINLHKVGVSNCNLIRNEAVLGKATRELFVQFMARICIEIPLGKLAQFSKLKYINAPNFVKFRQFFRAKFKAGFVVPADTFINVKGQFPIGFLIWDMADKQNITSVECDVYNSDGKKIGAKNFYVETKTATINDWLKNFIDKGEVIGGMCCIGTDFQHQNFLHIAQYDNVKVGNAKGIAKFAITKTNIIPTSIYFSARSVLHATWLNDRDQFLYPNEGWKQDSEFQNDCLSFTLFHSQNRIKSVSAIIGAQAPGVIPAKAGIQVNSNAIPSSLSVETNNEKRNSVKMDACGRRHDSVGYYRGRENDNGDSCGCRHDNGDSRFSANDSGAETSAGDGGTPVVNHWIPFKAARVGARDSFASNFMSDFIKARGEFSAEAKEVFDAGKKLWTYYQKDIYNNESENVNASLYEIREYFRGRTEAGRMKSFSDNEDFQKLDDALKSALSILADKIAEKVYEYGFLKK